MNLYTNLGRAVREFLVHVVCISEIEEGARTLCVLQRGDYLQLCDTLIFVLRHPGVALLGDELLRFVI